MIVDERVINESDILDAKELLDSARSEGDQLKIDLREASLNDLLERYSCHSCHSSQTEDSHDRSTRTHT